MTHSQGLINFYSSLCASQECINSYANLVETCFELNQDKVYICIIDLLKSICKGMCIDPKFTIKAK